VPLLFVGIVTWFAIGSVLAAPGDALLGVLTLGVAVAAAGRGLRARAG